MRPINASDADNATRARTELGRRPAKAASPSGSRKASPVLLTNKTTSWVNRKSTRPRQGTRPGSNCFSSIRQVSGRSRTLTGGHRPLLIPRSKVRSLHGPPRFPDRRRLTASEARLSRRLAPLDALRPPGRVTEHCPVGLRTPGDASGNRGLNVVVPPAAGKRMWPTPAKPASAAMRYSQNRHSRVSHASLVSQYARSGEEAGRALIREPGEELRKALQQAPPVR